MKEKVIYHYTDANGLKGILENQTLWATHYRYLNDKEEMNLLGKAINLRYPSIISGMSSIDKTDLLSKFVDSLNFLDSILIGSDNSNGQETFVLSFCEKDDLLSQWRGYGKHGAYAIGFNSKKLLPFLRGETDSFKVNLGRFDKVTYFDGIVIPDELLPIIDELINDICTYIQNPLDTSLSNNIIIRYNAWAPFIKHKGFEEEREFRAVLSGFSSVDYSKGISHSKVAKVPFQPSETIKFRNVTGTLIPYIELFANKGIKLPIVDIIVGPSKDMNMRKKSLELMLIQKEFDPKIVRLSSIPYVGD